jgi:hypothetical protein
MPSLAQVAAPEQQRPLCHPDPAEAQATGIGSSPIIVVKDPKVEAPASHRLLWIIPNAKTQPLSAETRPLSTREKWQLVKKDALDPTAALTAGFVGGLGMALDLHHEFGGGIKGAAKYSSAALAGQQVSRVMTGGVFPTLLRQDPRFFTRGSGSPGSRIVYALSRELVTRGDNGHPQFNFSEMAGVAVAASVGNIYYTGSRGAGPTAFRFGTQIGINAGFNVLKEFWPSIEKKLTRKK